MNLSVSPPIRILAILGGVLAVAAGLLLYVQGRPAADANSLPAPVAKTAHPAVTKATAVPAKPAHAAPTAPVAKPPPKPASGLPAALDAALARNEVVVVSLYVPGAKVDELATAEARAGAALGGAGFVALDVLDEEAAQPLLAKLGVLEDPTVLVFRRPGEAVVRMSGFADRETVAQAAANAAS